MVVEEPQSQLYNQERERAERKEKREKKIMILLMVSIIIISGIAIFLFFFLDKDSSISTSDSKIPRGMVQINEKIIGPPQEPRPAGRWKVISQTGNEANFDITFTDEKEKKTEICLTLKDGVNESEVDLTDKTIYDIEGNPLLDDKDKTITMKYESAKCNGEDGYHISLTDAKAININDYIKFGDASVIMIYITDAQHLNSTRGFIENVYDEVMTLDGNYTILPQDDYIRVQFEEFLTNKKDITIWANSTINSTVILEVYVKDGNVSLGQIEIHKFNLYQFFLHNLTGSYDTFDLKPINGDISIDYIVDPTSLFIDPVGDSTPLEWVQIGAPPNSIHASGINTSERQPTVPNANGIESTGDGEIETFEMGNIDLNGGTVTNITIWTFAISGSADDSEGYTVNISDPEADVQQNITIGAGNDNTWIGMSFIGSFSESDINDIKVTITSDITGGGTAINIIGMYAELVNELESCIAITSPGDYLMTGDIINSGTSNCINIFSDNVDFNCAGHLVDGDDVAQTGIAIGAGYRTQTNVTIRNCNMSDWAGGNGIGAIHVPIFSSNININNVTITSGVSAGIRTDRATTVRITDSIFRDNSYGLWLQEGSDMVVVNNTMAGNSYGILSLFDGSNTNVYNNILNNTNNFFMVSGYTHNWNVSQRTETNIISGSFIGGNLWAAPAGSGFSDLCDDDDNNGICDDSFTIQGANIDFLPLKAGVAILPSIIITSPGNFTAINGEVNLLVSATGSNLENAHFEYINLSSIGTGGTFLCNETVVPYTCLWNTTLLENNTEGYVINVTLFNVVGDTDEDTKTYIIDRTVPKIKDITVVYPSGQLSIRDGQEVFMRFNVSDAPEEAAGINTTTVDLVTINLSTSNTSMTFEDGSLAPDEWSSWNISVTVNGTTGLQNAPITIFDNATPNNNIRRGDQFSVQIDNDNPTWLNVGDSGDDFNSSDVTFSVDAFDLFDLDHYIFSIFNETTQTWANDTNATMSGTGFSIGVVKFDMPSENYTFKFYIFDDAGNLNETANDTLEIFGSRPGFRVDLLSPPNGINLTSGSGVQFNYSYNNGDAVNCTLTINGDRNLTQVDPVPPNATINSFSQNFTEGFFSWDVFCNNGTVIFFTDSGPRSFTVDTGPPVFDVGSPFDMQEKSGNTTFQLINATDGTTIIYAINESTFFQIDQNGRFSTRVPMVVGFYNINVTLTDEVNNQNSSVFFVNVSQAESTEPQIFFTAPTLVNNTIINFTNNSIPINITIIEPSFSELIFTWNETNFTMFSSNLVAMYNFNRVTALGENDSRLLDISNVRNNGTITGATFIDGIQMGAYDFDGVDDVINLTGNLGGIIGSDRGTFSAWFRTNGTSTDVSVDGSLFSISDASGSNNLFMVKVGNSTGGFTDESLSYILNRDGSVKLRIQIRRGELFWKDGLWHNVVVVTGQFNNTMYVDGINQAPFITFQIGNSTTQEFSELNNVDTAMIGARQNNGVAIVDFFNGTIDEIRMWNIPLNESEIHQQYVSNLYKYRPNEYQLIVNQTHNISSTILRGNYTYSAHAQDTGLNNNMTNVRSVEVGDELLPDPEFPLFTNIRSNNGSINNEGTAILNVTVLNTNGTVILEFNSSNFTATNIVGDIYNVSIPVVNGTYSYLWSAWGNGTLVNYNTTLVQNYVVNTSAADTSFPFFSNLLDNNGSIVGTGTAILNVSVDSTNGTVILQFNNTNFTATNPIGNIYAQEIPVVTGIYNYTWSAFGNGTDALYNTTLIQSYQVNESVVVQRNVSLNNAEFHLDEIIFNSPNYIPIFNGTFNLTMGGHITFKGVGAIRKETSGAASTLSLRLIHNGKTIFDSDIRSIQGLTDRGVFNIPINDSIAVAGMNNLTLEAKEDGPGAVNLSSLEVFIDTDITNDGKEINHTQKTFQTVFSSTSFINIFNLSITNPATSNTLIDIQHTVSSDGSSDIINCYIENEQTGEISPTYSRWLENSGDRGSTGVQYISKTENSGVNNWMLLCNSDDTNNIGNNITGYSLSLTNSSTSRISNFQNESIGTLSLTGINNKIVEIRDYEVRNGTNIQLMGTAIIQSTSGKQDGDSSPRIFINSTAQNCTHGYRRSLSSNSDIGTVKLYVDCEDLVVGNKYNITMYGDVVGGETLSILNSSLSGFEIVELDIITGIVPPTVAIVNPLTDINITGVIDINATVTDTSGLGWTSNVTLRNPDGSFNFGIFPTSITNDSSLNTTFDTTAVADGNYLIFWNVSNSAGNSFDNVNITIDNTNPLVNFSLPTFGNGTNHGASAIPMNVTVTELNFINITFDLWNSTSPVNRTTFTTRNYFLNVTGLNNGNYTYNVSVIDSVGNVNFTETRTVQLFTFVPADISNPQLSNNFSVPVSPGNYSFGGIFSFNITWTDDVALDIVLMEFAGINYTMDNASSEFFFNFDDLSAGSHNYYFWANDTSGNFNQTDTQIYIINQAVPSLDITFSPAQRVANGTETTVEGTESNDGDGGCSYNLFNATNASVSNPHVFTWNVGSFDYTFNATGCTNYTTFHITEILNVTAIGDTTCAITFNETIVVQEKTLPYVKLCDALEFAAYIKLSEPLEFT